MVAELDKRSLSKLLSEINITSKSDVPRAKSLKELQQHANTDQLVAVIGHVLKKRDQNKRMFLDIQFGSGNIVQAVLEKTVKGEEGAELYKTITHNCSLVLQSKVEKLGEKHSAPGGIELKVENFQILGPSPAGGVGNIVTESSTHETLFDERILALRYPKYNVWIRLLSLIIKSCRDFCVQQGMTEIYPPTILNYTTEGGSEVFKVDYFGRPAFLTQSSQLYLEAAAPALGDCFCVMPSYRAEKSRTIRHLTEYTHFEGELQFVTFEDLLQHLEGLIKYVNKIVCQSGLLEEIKTHHKDVKFYEIGDEPFARFRYSEYVKMLKEYGITKEGTTDEYYSPDEDVPSGAERKFCDKFGKPFFLTHFPANLKAFYMYKDEEDPTLTHSVDLCVPGCGEIVGGSVRMTSLDELEQGIEKEVPITPDMTDEQIAIAQATRENYKFYKDLRKYGTSFTAGYGLGASRLVMFYGCPSIQYATFLPRTCARTTP